MDGDHLRVREGPAAGTALALTAELWIGRDAEDGGNLGGDEYLSRHHARLNHTTGSDPVIEDLGSTNGTYVNGERLRGSRALRDGDTIKVGHTVLTVMLGSAAVRTVQGDVDARPSSGGGRGKFDLPEDMSALEPAEGSPAPVGPAREPPDAAYVRPAPAQPDPAPGQPSPASAQPSPEPVRRAPRTPPVVGSPSVIRA